MRDWASRESPSKLSKISPIARVGVVGGGRPVGYSGRWGVWRVSRHGGSTHHGCGGRKWLGMGRGRTWG